MYYKYSQITSRIQPADVVSAYNRQSFVEPEPPRVAKPSPPHGSVAAAPSPSSPSGGGIVHRMNRTKLFQKLFTESTTADLPVFLRRGSFDAIAYRGVMVFSVVGIGLTFWCIGQIATGRMQKKH
jgi:hypothetical protein